MPYIESMHSGENIKIHYEIHGSGKPVVFIHGWPLSGSMWEYQLTYLTQKNIQCIVYDRRGFGKSDRPHTGYDYDCLAKDVKVLLDELNLDEVTLVGFSMGGGEVARYFTLFGGARVKKVVLIGSILPYLTQTPDHPEGSPREELEKIGYAITEDRPGFFEGFKRVFYGADKYRKVSDAFLQDAQVKIMDASPFATLECAKSFSFTDFREELKNIQVPCLIIHGDADEIVPKAATSDIAAKKISGAEYKIYKGAPHGLWFTDKDKLNKDLEEFILK